MTDGKFLLLKWAMRKVIFNRLAAGKLRFALEIGTTPEEYKKPLAPSANLVNGGDGGLRCWTVEYTKGNIPTV